MVQGIQMKVLLATDGSTFSEAGARFLAKLNFTADDEITVFHAINWIPIVSEWEYIYDDLRAIKEEVAPRILASAAEMLKTSHAHVTTLSAEDSPDRAIVEKAAESHVDLIVMGARGMRGLSSRIVGSVTKSVAIKSSQPVLIVHPGKREEAESMNILFATDGSSHSEGTAGMLAAIPFPAESEVTILSVMPSAYLDIPERFSVEIDDRMKKIVADIREKDAKALDEILESARKQLATRFSKTEKMTRTGDPPIEILDAADKSQADIIAVGSSGKRGIRGMIGSVSRYILNHAKCSVLIGKAGL